MMQRAGTTAGTARWRRVAVVVVTLALAGLSACGGGAKKEETETTLTVFAAASLTKTFTEIGSRFEAEHEGTKVTFNFGGSSDLVAQIQQGAPADVFASADTKNMDKIASDIQGAPVEFASNTLQIVTPPDNPVGIKTLADLTKPGVRVVVCAPEVPCGSATVKVEDASGVDIKPVSEESSVTDVLGKVTSGAADAGLVYVTDATGAGDAVHAVAFPESAAAVNVYPIGALAASKRPELAAQFVSFVTGTVGQRILADAGFARP